MIDNLTTWRLDLWNVFYSKDSVLNPMTKPEIEDAIIFLRVNNYPKPEDCPLELCVDYRLACKIGICSIALGMCGDL